MLAGFEGGGQLEDEEAQQSLLDVEPVFICLCCVVVCLCYLIAVIVYVVSLCCCVYLLFVFGVIS